MVKSLETLTAIAFHSIKKIRSKKLIFEKNWKDNRSQHPLRFYEFL